MLTAIYIKVTRILIYFRQLSVRLSRIDNRLENIESDISKIRKILEKLEPEQATKVTITAGEVVEQP